MLISNHIRAVDQKYNNANLFNYNSFLSFIFVFLTLYKGLYIIVVIFIQQF